jgi:hypothetical protein
MLLMQGLKQIDEEDILNINKYEKFEKLRNSSQEFTFN